MKKFDYEKLCSICDKLINDDLSISRVSISFLHIIRPHPISAKNYKQIFMLSDLNFSIHILKKLILRFIQYLISWLNILFEKKSSIENSKTADVFFISHLFNLDQIKSKNDLYFSNLITDLSLSSISSRRIFINHSNLKVSRTDDDFIIGRSSTLNEILIRIMQLKEFIKLLIRLFSINKSNVERRISVYASIEALSHSTLNNLKIYFFIKKLLLRHSPKLVITTFEGYAYERIIFNLVNSKPKIISAGYQHAAIFKDQYSITRDLKEIYNPKFIFTSGKITKDIFLKFYNQTRLIEIGSSRGDMAIKKNKNAPYILVIPEGLIEDVDLFINFIKEITEKIKKFNFLIRFHPLISTRQIKERMFLLKNNPNIVFSEDTLINDIKKSSYVFYRGSTAVFSALIAGLTPLYYNHDEVNLNPLYEMEEYIQTITNVEDFNSIKENNLETNKKIISYCKQYYTNFKISGISNLIK